MIIKTQTMELNGTNYEIGQKLAKLVAGIPQLKAYQTGGMKGCDETEVRKAVQLFERWCPGLNDELQGFADGLEVPLWQVVYFGMTYLRPAPRCSQIAVLPSMTESGRPLLARNYEFNQDAEDFCLVKTSVAGKYTHIGTSVLFFGRDDGFNEHGLAVTMSSCGFPVGPLPNMRPPKVTGLQFWAVIRSVLENCRDVAEALDYIKEMPIAYNINMMLVDKAGNIALVETLDGRFAVRSLDEGSDKRYLHATNHPVLPELIPFEPQAMKHSLMRYDWIERQMEKTAKITPDILKEMLLSEFPDGLCCHYYPAFFGTTKSMVINPGCGTIDLCWGGDIRNGWKQYHIERPLPVSGTEIELQFKEFPVVLGEFVPLQ